MSTLTQAQIEQLAAQVGPGDSVTAAAIAMAESSGRSDAVGTNGDGSRDRGLWQINDHWHAEVSDACAFDPACNAQAAYAISNGWSNFHAWTTFQTGDYQRFLGGGVATQAPPAPRSLAGQGGDVVGSTITSPWFAGAWEVTQGWGVTDFSGEPEGHGAPHWHAGVDVGLDSGTVISLPAGLSGAAVALDNPGGYGTALLVRLDSGLDVLLGHLRQRLVSDGEQLRPGAELAVSDSTGNSTGPHLHFEVRPAGGRYGTDLDPSALLAGEGGGGSISTLSFNPVADLEATLQKGIQQAVTATLNSGQVALGGALLLGGLLLAGYGLRGQPPARLRRDLTRTLRPRRRPLPRPRRAPVPTGAAATRLRPNLQPPAGGAP